MAITFPDIGLKKKLNPLGQAMDTAGQEANKNANAFKGLPKAQSAQVANAPYDWKTAPSPFTKENAPKTTGALSGGGTTREMKKPLPVTPQVPKTAVPTTIAPKQSAPIPKQNTSMIPVVNAGESIDTNIAQSAISDIHAGMPIEEFDAIYPELATSKGLFEQYALDVQAGMPQEEGIKMYPELFGQAPTPVPQAQSPKEQSFIGGAIDKTIEGAKAGIGRIGEAGEGLATGKYNFAEAAVRGGAGALETTFSPISGVLGQGIKEGVEELSSETKKSVGEFASPKIQAVKEWYNSQTPEQKRNLDNIGVGVEVLANFIGGKAVQKSGEAIVKTGYKTPEIISKIEKFSEKATTPKSVRIDVATGKTFPTLKTVTKAVKDVEKSNDLISRGLKPTIVGKDTGNKIKVFQDKVRQGIESVSKTQGNAKDGIDALTKAGNRKKEIFSTIDKNNEFVTKVTPDTEVASKIKTYMETPEYKLLEKTNPGLTNKLETYKKIYSKGDNLSQNDLQILKTNQNNKIPASYWAEMLTTDKDALLADSMIAKILGDTIDDNIEAVLGKTNQSLNREYGAVRELEKNLARRMGVFQLKTKGGLAGMTDIFSLPDIIIGGLTGDVKQVAKGLLQKTVSTIIRDKENPNRIVKELFNLHGKKEGILQKALGLQDQSLNIKLGENANLPTSPAGITPIVRSIRNKGAVQATGGNTVGATKKINLAEEKAKAGLTKKPTVLNKVETPLKTKNPIIQGLRKMKDIPETFPKKDIQYKRSESTGPMRVGDIIKGSRKEALYKEFENRQNKLHELSLQKEMKGENLTGYPDDLLSAMKKIKSVENRTMRQGKLDEYSNIELLANKNPTFRNFVDRAKEYIDEIGSNKSIQEIFDDIITPKANAPQPLKPQLPAKSVQPKSSKPSLLNLSQNKKGFINPGQIGKDLGLVKKVPDDLKLKNEYREGFHILNNKGESVMNLGEIDFEKAKEILKGVKEGSIKIPESVKDLSIPDEMRGIARKVSGYDRTVYRTDNAKDLYKGKSVFGEGRYYSLKESDAGKITKTKSSVQEHTLPKDLKLLEVNVSNNYYQNGQRSETWRNSFKKMIQDKGFDGAIIKVSDDPKFNLSGDQIVIYNTEKLPPKPLIKNPSKKQIIAPT